MMKLLICFLLLVITCSSLTFIANGMSNCSLGVHGVYNPGDTCIVTCNNGYKLTGSSIRTCQNDGNWRGIHTTCSRGE